MPTSGSANLTYTGTQLVDEARKRFGVTIPSAAETYTSAATIIAAAYRRIGLHNASITETYSTPAEIASEALKRVGLHSATTQQQANAEDILAGLGAEWGRYGLTKSGENYPRQWEETLILNTALRFAMTIGRSLPPELAPLASSSLQASIAHPTADQGTAAQQVLDELQGEWLQYGMTMSGATYPDRWVGAFTLHAAIRLAMENRSPISPELREMAAMSLQEAKRTTARGTHLNELNMLVQNFYGRGLRAWSTKSQTVTLSADKVSYTLGESGKDVTMTVPPAVTQAYLRDAAGNDTPLVIWNRANYHAIPDKDDSGEPVGVFYDRVLNAETLYVWPVIAASGYSLIFTYPARLEEFDAIGDTAYCSPDWHEAIVSNLALVLAPQYERDVTRTMYETAATSLAVALGNSREIPRQPLMGWPNDAPDDRYYA